MDVVFNNDFIRLVHIPGICPDILTYVHAVKWSPWPSQLAGPTTHWFLFSPGVCVKHIQPWLSRSQVLIAPLAPGILHLLSIINLLALLSVSRNHHSAAGGRCYPLGSCLLKGKNSAKRHSLSRSLFSKDGPLWRDWSRSKGHWVLCCSSLRGINAHWWAECIAIRWGDLLLYQIMDGRIFLLEHFFLWSSWKLHRVWIKPIMQKML